MKDIGKLVLYEDNKSAKDAAETPGETKNLRHIDVKYHFVKGKVETGLLENQLKQ